MLERMPITPGGLERLKAELKRLKSEDRPNIVRAIEEARAHGDLSENAEYHAAKEKQGLIEARLRMVEDRIGRAHVIDPATLSGTRVSFGATVTLVDLDSDDESTWVIVGDEETDLKRNFISVNSPFARGLLGQHQGNEVTIRTPRGEKTYEVVSVEFKAVTFEDAA